LDPALAGPMTARATAVLNRHHGATGRIIELLVPLSAQTAASAPIRLTPER
jgi:hypothetical protein